MELLPAVVGPAVADSVNPSALLATIALLLRGRPARPLVAVYVAAILVTYFAIGLALTLGLGLTPEAAIESDAAYLAQGVLGAAMLAYAVVGAVGAITRADLAVGDWLPLLAVYNLIFVLPPLALLTANVALGDRAGACSNGSAPVSAAPPARAWSGSSAWSGSPSWPTPSATSGSSADRPAESLVAVHQRVAAGGLVGQAGRRPGLQPQRHGNGQPLSSGVLE